MIIHKSLYKSLNNSLQIILSIAMNNKNSQEDHYAMMLFFKKNADVRGRGVWKLGHMRQGGGG